MSIITNELNLPLPLVEAIRNDNYNASACDYSTTTLITPPRIVALRREYSKHITEDASDRIFSLIGQSIHTILERAASARYIIERRFIAEFGGVKVGGQVDIFDTETGVLQDWKVCSRYVAADGAKPEWIQQASVNALLMYREGILVSKAQIVAIFRDWLKMQASRDRDYPQRQVAVIDLPLWSQDKTEAFINERIALHEAAKVKLPECTADERWERPTRYALMRKGAKRAVKLYDTQAEANAAASGDDKLFTELRPGEPVRCLNYCSVLPYCSQGRAYMEEKL